MSDQLTPGVIGGMGPEATIDLMYRVFNQTPADDDGGHIRLLVDNNPKVPSRIKAIIEGTGESPAPCMIEMAQGLVKQGADFLVIPCNTAHYYYQDVADSVDVPVINLLDITAQQIRSQGCISVGVLGSTALQITNIYGPVFESHRLRPVYPDTNYQDQLMGLIKAIKAQSVSGNDLEALDSLLRHMAEKHVDCLALVCTELSVIKDKIKSDVPVFDAVDILSKEIIERAKLIKPNQ
ncbi:amino acid racemase [Vibrio brasiliensis]|uniref:aspartate/glutamate racemase family protein n=1 Tax=Vibrio brasiliensis TaxID=170652 RepID=UPI001EFE83A2|nr:amino acid racemase [Vibrio brasiliensis]MCG9648601.1 amino acid racemase [Vibrio brasiliensis]